MLQLNHTGANSILVSTPTILQYVKERYPYYECIGSEYYILNDPNLEHLEDLTFIRCYYHNILENVPKNKIIVTISNYCSECAEKINCQCQMWESQFNFHNNTKILQCPNVKFESLDWESIEKLIRQGYSHFCFDTSCIPYHDADRIMQLYITTFVKPEYQDLVELIMRGYKKL